MTKKVFEVLSGSNETVRVCSFCKSSKAAFRSIAKLEGRLESIESAFGVNNDKLNNMSKEVQNYCRRVEELEDELESIICRKIEEKLAAFPGAGNAGKLPGEAKGENEDVIKAILAEIRERDDREARKNNIIIHGIPESSAQATHDKISYDCQMAVTKLKELTGLDINSEALVHVIRLGRPSERPRPLRLTLIGSLSRDQVIRAADARKSRDERRKITRDLTQKQREEARDYWAKKEHARTKTTIQNRSEEPEGSSPSVNSHDAKTTTTKPD